MLTAQKYESNACALFGAAHEGEGCADISGSRTGWHISHARGTTTEGVDVDGILTALVIKNCCRKSVVSQRQAQTMAALNAAIPRLRTRCGESPTPRLARVIVGGTPISGRSAVPQ